MHWLATHQRKLWVWLPGLVLTALGAWLVGLLSTAVPTPSEALCMAGEAFFARAASGANMTVLVATLVGDDDGRHTGHVTDVFLDQEGLELLQSCRKFDLKPGQERSALEWLARVMQTC